MKTKDHTNMNDDWVAENWLAEQTGVSLEEFRRARNGTRWRHEQDWVRRERRIWWHKTAAALLCNTWGLVIPPLADKSAGLGQPETARANSVDGSTEQKGAAAAETGWRPPELPKFGDDVVALQVWRGPNEGIRNRAMVEAVAYGTRPKSRGEIVRVLVGDNRKLRRDVIIFARRKDGDLYERVKGMRRQEPEQKEVLP